MYSHIALHLVSACVETLTKGLRPNFCTYPIKYAIATLMTLPEGQLLLQSFSHYLVHMELFEYMLREDFSIHYAVHTEAIFMLLTLEGDSSSHIGAQEISTSSTGCYHLIHTAKGSYTSTLPPGNHKFLLLTFRPEWLLRNSQDLPEFQSLVRNFNTQDKAHFSLPECRMDKDINTSIKKIQQHEGENSMELEAIIQQFVHQVINVYHQMLASGQYSTREIHQRKAAELASFIKTNYCDQLANDVPKLALHFNVSERILLRLARIAFGKPLHEQVIEFKLLRALELLTTTDKSVKRVAMEVGYPDPHYFSKAFKKYHGFNPREVAKSF